MNPDAPQATPSTTVEQSHEPDSSPERKSVWSWVLAFLTGLIGISSGGS